IEATDRQGNQDEWGDKPRATVSTNRFDCSGDACLCCFISNGRFDGPCENLPGVYAPEDPDGKCGDPTHNPRPDFSRCDNKAPCPPFSDGSGGCFFPAPGE
ncbi:MAG: hypothetical protein ACRDH5_05350, partial [bacterium]